jgi:ABC-type sugar transport system ATPase subunit
MESEKRPSLLKISNASKSYSGVPALIDASLDLRAGEVHALIGENGAGKSTLIKLMAGVVRPDSMQVELRGRPVAIHQAGDAFRLGLRFIHQELNIVPQISVAENIFLGQPYPRLAGVLVDWGSLNEAARAVLHQLDITHINVRQTMARLSPGDQMLVSIARAFVGDDVAGKANTGAAVYVMDEPTAALTRQETELLFKVIDHLKQRGSAVLYVSHRLEEIFKIADRITIMRDGRVVDTCDIAQVRPADLIRMMTGRSMQQLYPARSTPVGDRVLLAARGVRTRAVHDVSFQLAEGQIIGIAGLNGSGRTELLRALVGLDRLLAGEIWLNGQPLRDLSPTQAWKRGIAFVPEERRSQGLILSRSIRDNVTLPQLRHLSRGGWMLDYRLERQTSQHLGEQVRLKATGTEQTTRQLSGGNQQKVVFARALARPPRVLLLDEPTRGVDVGAKADIYGLIRQISAAGTGILMVSSDLPELVGMTDRILIMRGGALVDNVQTAGLDEEKVLSLCYGEIHYERA